ncbi:hypothetical protein [Shimia sediminis]|uniref:hypothetical protein n=1 Tax=Shimia sediminis TaxID=2497945 RepID=UPI000F8C6071|nr:hypothetical protein [Shimia sediminis]
MPRDRAPIGQLLVTSVAHPAQRSWPRLPSVNQKCRFVAIVHFQERQRIGLNLVLEKVIAPGF